MDPRVLHELLLLLKLRGRWLTSLGKKYSCRVNGAPASILRSPPRGKSRYVERFRFGAGDRPVRGDRRNRVKIEASALDGEAGVLPGFGLLRITAMRDPLGPRSSGSERVVSFFRITNSKPPERVILCYFRALRGAR